MITKIPLSFSMFFLLGCATLLGQPSEQEMKTFYNEVRKTVNKQQASVLDCARTVSKVNGARSSEILGKDFTVSFEIDGKGQVAGEPEVQWERSSMKNRKVVNCVVYGMKDWQFPKSPTGDPVNVAYTYYIFMPGAKTFR